MMVDSSSGAPQIHYWAHLSEGARSLLRDLPRYIHAQVGSAPALHQLLALRYLPGARPPHAPQHLPDVLWLAEQPALGVPADGIRAAAAAPLQGQDCLKALGGLGRGGGCSPAITKEVTL